MRERAYGSEGVDLTAYGIGTGPVDFVQSIYFRFFVDLEAGSYDSFIARVEFPAEVTILGIIIDNDELGGSIDDGVATEMDNIFGVAADREALAILEAAVPDRPVVPIPSQNLVLGLGAVHCLTQQEPAFSPR